MDKDKSLKEIVLEDTDKPNNDSKSCNSGLIRITILALVFYLAFTMHPQAHPSPGKSNYNVLTHQNYPINQQYKINKTPLQSDYSPGYLK